MGNNRVFRNRSMAELSRWVLRRSIGLSTAGLRRLPDFLIIGAQRCGTTSLFEYLCQHPDLYPSFPKEVHFFTNYYHKGICWYRSHFPFLDNHSYSGNPKGHTCITGEATPYYLAHPHAARRASQVVPGALLIVLLRDPVKRAYSHYHHEVSMGLEKLSFEQAIDQEAGRLEGELDKMLEDETYKSFNYQHYSYLTRGHYSNQIRQWMQFFPSKAIMFINSADLNTDPQTTYRKVTDYLGLKPWDQCNFRRYHQASYTAMHPDLKKRLREYFKPYNQELFRLTQLNFNQAD